MKRDRNIFKNILISLIILAVCFSVSLLLQRIFPSQSLVSVIFVLAVFLISLTTQGYVYGISAALISVLIDNFAFTFPYFKFDFIIIENIVSALVMLAVSVLTGTLTTKIKEQEKIRAESENEKMRANLLRAISHDLRTPLTTIYGSCSAVIENYDSLGKGQQLKLLGEIREDSESLIRTVENLLSVTRVSGNEMQLKKVPTVLEELIDACILKFNKRYPGYPLTVNIPDEFISIPMDALLIEQVIMNILENAVFHAKGMTELTLSVHIDSGNAVFDITDNGCGIDNERLDTLFSGYQCSSNTPADSARRGMGIGLSVCSTVIKAHGGTIRAGNRTGSGAFFSFTLKTEDNADEQQQ